MSQKPPLNPALLKKLQAQRTPRGAQPKGTLQEQVLDLLARFDKDMNKATDPALTLMWLNRNQLADGGPLQQLATPLVERWAAMSNTPTFRERMEHFAGLFDCKEALHQQEKQVYENANRHGRDTLYWMVKNAASVDEAHEKASEIRAWVRSSMFMALGDLVEGKLGEAEDARSVIERWFADAGLGPLVEAVGEVLEPDPLFVSGRMRSDIDFLGPLPTMTSLMLSNFGADLALHCLPDAQAKLAEFLRPGMKMGTITKAMLRSFHELLGLRAAPA